MEEIRIKQNTKKHIKMILLCFLMVVASLLGIYLNTEQMLLNANTYSTDYLQNIVADGRASQHGAFVVICILVLCFFVIGLISFIKQLFNPKDILVINENGYIHNTSFFSLKFVFWEDVADICIHSLYINPCINVYFKDVQKILNNASRLQKTVILMCISSGNSPTSINLATTNENYLDILNIMQKYLDAYHLKTSEENIHFSKNDKTSCDGV